MTPHPDHQRRVEEILGSVSWFASDTPARVVPFAPGVKRWFPESSALIIAERLTRAEDRADENERWGKRADDYCGELKAELARLRAQPLDDCPWPLRDVLERLATGADHLLREHDCDQHGHEELAAARNAARSYLRDLRIPPTGERSDLREYKGAVYSSAGPELAQAALATTPTLTDHERIERLDDAFAQIDRLRDMGRPCLVCNYVGETADGIKMHNPRCPVGAIAGEVASRS